MPWRCPACLLPINHSPIETRPRAGAKYRCHVCRLELRMDERTNKLAVPPMEIVSDDDPTGASNQNRRTSDRKNRPR
jgi:hypothetical protein